MEEREKGSKEKADTLLKEYQDRFRFIIASFHPPNLPNEMPGKASNTRWAAQVGAPHDLLWRVLPSRVDGTRQTFPGNMEVLGGSGDYGRCLFF